MTKTVITFFEEKYRVTLSFTAPGDTNASDAAGINLLGGGNRRKRRHTKNINSRKYTAKL